MLRALGVTGPIKLVNAYIMAGTLNQHATNARNGTATGLVRQEFSANGKYTETPIQTNGSFLALIKEEPWDVITLQQGSTSSGVASTYNVDLTDLISYVNNNKTNLNFKFGWHMTWAWALTGAYNSWSPYSGQNDMYTKICSAVQTAIVPKGFDFIIPTGTAIQNYRGVYGDILNDTDNTHLNNLGHYIATAMWIKTIAGYDFSNLVTPYYNSQHYNTGTPITIDATLRDRIALAVNNADASPGYN